jgi:hypothetical protein
MELGSTSSGLREPMQANRQEVSRARTGLRPRYILGWSLTPAGERCCQGHCNKREGREMQLFR